MRAVSSLYEVASLATHSRACPHTGYSLVWIDDQGHISRECVAMATMARLCLSRACPHPLHSADPRFVHLHRIPPAWREWEHLTPKELLF